MKLILARDEGDSLRQRLAEFDTTAFAAADAAWRDAGQPKLGRFARERDIAALIRAALHDALEQNKAAVEAYEDDLLSAGDWADVDEALTAVLPAPARHALGAPALDPVRTPAITPPPADDEDLPPEI
ncbi:hypothetical protein GS531_00685 [Rhodococcus hoagii]|nr:hypothetical protein [Prescottella equi]